MSNTATTLEELKNSIVDGNDSEAELLAQRLLEEGLTPGEILNSAVLPGIERAGQLWREGEYFMPDVILSAEAFKTASGVLESRLKEDDTPSLGKFVFGVVAGDMHDLGATLVAAMMQGAGFEVDFIGVDVPTADFVERVRKNDVDILGIGAYMTATMLTMKEVIEALEKENLRDKVKLMVGGVALTQQFADEIGADAWGKDALDTVVKAKDIMGVK